MNFAIVEFTTTKEVEVVSCGWIHGKNCFWPPFDKSKKIRKLVINHAIPENTWCTYAVKIINIFETYELARLRLSKAEETSDLASELENKGRGKRTKRKRRFSSSSTNSCSSAKDLNLPILPSPPRLQSLENSFTLHTDESVPGSPSLLSDNFSRNVVSANHNFQRTALKEIMIIKETQRQQSEMLQLILNKINNEANSRILEIDSSPDVKEILSELPIKSNAELEIFEFKLVDMAIFESVCHSLSLSGESSSDYCVKAMMKKLISNEFASNYSYCGARGKKPFKGLKICHLVFDAVRKVPQLSKTTDQEIETSIKNWLRHAKARFLNACAHKNKNVFL